MRLTTKGRYAVMAMLDLALHQDKGPVPLAHISQRQHISVSYLEQLFARLRRCELVESVRGPGGGYILAREMGEVFVAEIIHAVDETLDVTRCGRSGSCQSSGEYCLTHQLWIDLSDQILQFLNGISLGQLVHSRAVQDVNKRQQEHPLVGVQANFS